jgi:hypothetical protein
VEGAGAGAGAGFDTLFPDISGVVNLFGHRTHCFVPPSLSPQFNPVSVQPDLHFQVLPPSEVSLGMNMQSAVISSSILPYASMAGASSFAFMPSTTPMSYPSSMAAEQSHFS